MGRFDGVALLAARAPDEHSRPLADRTALLRAIDQLGAVRLPDGTVAHVDHPLGVPRWLPALAPEAAAATPTDATTSPPLGDGWQVDPTVATPASATSASWGDGWQVDPTAPVAEVVLIGLTPARPRTSRADLDDLDAAVRRAGAAPEHLAVLPPVPVDDLVGVRPLTGSRVHLGLHGTDLTVCGRLPLRGDPHDPAYVDCRRCLRSTPVASRFDQQLRHLDDLIALAGPLLVGAAARLWQRLHHRDVEHLPPLLDSMTGALAYRLPGAPDTDEVLTQVRRHRQVASSPVRRWAAAQALQRLEVSFRRLAAEHPTDLPFNVTGRLDITSGLLDPAEAADLLVTALEEDGPAPALEPLVAQLARRAGEDRSERVERWYRRQRVAAALAGGARAAGGGRSTRDSPSTRPSAGTHDGAAPSPQPVPTHPSPAPDLTRPLPDPGAAGRSTNRPLALSAPPATSTSTP